MPMKYLFTLSIIFHSAVCSVSENIMSGSTQLAGSSRPSTENQDGIRPERGPIGRCPCPVLVNWKQTKQNAAEMLLKHARRQRKWKV